MSSKVKRYAAIMALGVILNLGLYDVAHIFHLPAWIDSVGTAFVAVALEPAAGLLVAFATNFYQAAFIFDSSSIVYYTVSAMAALTFGILLRKDGKLQWRRLPIAMLAYIVTATLLSGLLTLWRTGGISDSAWERHFYDIAAGMGFPLALRCFFAAGVLKVVDTLILGVLLPALCGLLKPFINQEISDPVTMKQK